jgi:5'-methylthioadenosine phosphorylase
MTMDELKIGIIGGSGLAQLLGTQEQGKLHEIDTPFGWPSEAIVQSEWAGVPVYLLSRHGAGHTLNPSAVPYRANIFALKQLGCTHLIASGAVGSLREEMKPGDLVVPDQIIDKTRRVGSFFEKSAVHVEFAEPFCPVLRRILLESADSSAAVHDRGCYVAMEGPAFSTRAESLMHRIWGGDLVGMTGMPEAKLAREAEMSYAMVGLVTDYDCWKSKTGEPATLLEEIRGNLVTASGRAMELIRRAIGRMGEQREALLAAPARSALKLAIWSDKSKIAAEEVEQLRPIWGRYF